MSLKEIAKDIGLCILSAIPVFLYAMIFCVDLIHRQTGPAAVYLRKSWRAE